MLLNAMKCLNSVLNLTDLSSLDSFFELHDEKVLGMLCDVRDPSLGPKEISYVNLAKDYKKRELLKCIYEYFSLSRQRQELRPDEAIKNTGEHLKSDKKKRIFDAQVSKLKSIIGKYQASGEQVFLDISSAPSIPLAPKKEEVSSIMVVDKKDEYEKSFDQIPLIYVISGYLDMIRVYTNKENRKFYETIIKDSE